jgi:hypothetical protein
LLADLRAAADALDTLSRAHGLFHLGLSTRTLLLVGEQVQLADFGLAQLLWLPGGQAIAQLNARYSAPELFAGRASSACDQYSLALIYHELLTGALPSAPSVKAKPAGPRLERLPEVDRPIVARALSVDPRKRWESCLAFVDALESAALEGAPAAAGTFVPRPTSAAAGEYLQTCFGTTLAADLIRARLEGFREQWKGKAVAADANSLTFHMQAPQSFWQRWTGQAPGLEVHVQTSSKPANTEVCVDIRPRGRGQSAQMLKVVGPLLVESVRKHLQVSPRGRAEERLLWNHPLQVCFVSPDGSVGEPIACHGKDISLNGIGFYLPGELPFLELRLHLPATPQTPEMIVPAHIVRSQGCGDGWLEVGAILLHEREELPCNGLANHG